MGNSLPTILMAFTGPMLFTYMSVWIIVGLTARETTRISNQWRSKSTTWKSSTSMLLWHLSSVVASHLNVHIKQIQICNSVLKLVGDTLRQILTSFTLSKHIPLCYENKCWNQCWELRKVHLTERIYILCQVTATHQNKTQSTKANLFLLWCLASLVLHYHAKCNLTVVACIGGCK